MSEFKKYRRTAIAEMRPVTKEDIEEFKKQNSIYYAGDSARYAVSISRADEIAGSPKKGDMIARNPKNYNDQWLVAEQYFKDNFEEMEE